MTRGAGGGQEGKYTSVFDPAWKFYGVAAFIDLGYAPFKCLG